MSPVEEFIESFRQAGHKVTIQRRAIFELLAEAEGHPTADEIYQRLVTRMPEISRSTVYNTLNTLVALKQLTAVEDLSGSTRYDTNADQHHHLYCMGCGKLVDIERGFDSLTLSESEQAGYYIVRPQVTFYGYCPQCQSNEAG